MYVNDSAWVEGEEIERGGEGGGRRHVITIFYDKTRECLFKKYDIKCDQLYYTWSVIHVLTDRVQLLSLDGNCDIVDGYNITVQGTYTVPDIYIHIYIDGCSKYIHMYSALTENCTLLVLDI